MNWTQVDIYTATPAIDLLSVRLQDLGIRGCMVQDAQDFQEFLEQKDGKWDYLEDGLMELASCETCVTVYLPEDAQGAEMLAALRTMLAQMKAEDTEHQYGRLEAVCSGGVTTCTVLPVNTKICLPSTSARGRAESGWLHWNSPTLLKRSTVLSVSR